MKNLTLLTTIILLAFFSSCSKYMHSVNHEIKNEFNDIVTQPTVHKLQTVYLSPKKIVEINRYIDFMEAADKLIGTVSISENDVEVYHKDFGQKNLQAQLIVDESLMYQIGSITKMFTATLMAQLSEQGKIDFDEPLSNYFPNMANASNIKLSHMLNHTSGISDFVNKNNQKEGWLNKPISESTLLKEIEDQPVEFQAGDSLSYSNSAYYLLGKIVEQKYQASFHDIIEKQITKPLQLHNTYGINAENNVHTIAPSYEKEKGKWTAMQEFHFPNVIAVGDMISTPKDLNTFIAALFNGEIVKKSTLEKMLPKGDDWFGYGIMKVPFYDIKGYGHGGTTHGTHSVMSYNPSNGLAVTYIINGEDYPNNQFAIGLLSIIHDKAFEYPNFSTQEISENELDQYLGTYSSSQLPFKFEITKEGNILYGQGTDQPKVALSYKGEHEFSYEEVGAIFGFDPTQHKFKLSQGGATFEFTKELIK